MIRTVIVRVDRLRQHPKYLKFYRVSRRYKAHVTNALDYQPGDIVRIQESRPLSKEKRWKVLEIVKRVMNPASENTESSESEEVPIINA